jgi:ribose 1,5-bisphosphokinase
VSSERGRLVLVVGPSGVGKDSVIEGVRARLGGEGGVLVARRMVTRPSGDGEDHDSCDPETFDALEKAGAFALSWRAHGLAYGIPIAVEDQRARGRDVIANVSRTVVEDARRRLPPVMVVEITAPPDVLAARIAARGRGSDRSAAERVGRSAGIPAVRPDLVVDNGGALEAAVERMAAALAGDRAAFRVA